MLVNICMKFHEDILNGFKVTERTRFCLRNCYLQSSKWHNSKSINFVTDRQTDGQTDRQTDDPGKNNISPNPKGGDINN